MREELCQYRTTISQATGRRQHLSSDLASLGSALAATTARKEKTEEMLEISRKAARIVQDSLATKLSGIVTKAINTVFEEDFQFVAEFIERRNVSECDLYIKKDNHSYDILDSIGGGVADVCSVTLQLAFILLSDVSRVLIVDEVARHLSAPMQDRFAQVLTHLAKEFGFTIIMVTHAPAFAREAARVFEVSQRNGESRVKLIDGGAE
jgi:DNA repair ATPase RecN